ncbi:Ppx/GppA phosphatase family protein [Gryllotalpicola protaetiae]|uniref:Ppx/GppA family phosphatase n=1 Tax=Gryllotalpicola protaetiae TaxID=2419771 RepID=A0A387BNK1_9MICO|nr:Ppx/GppA phosphatase family protein [Gryllotalpicola protaetiae]AYG02699.1 Ppx/GppA family phosphatase [Gryllotalpicola protaetiae]
MRLGVLDIGSNTVHLVVVDAHRGARPTPFVDHKSVLRLMRYLDEDGAINSAGRRALVGAIDKAVRISREEGAEQLIAMATSAIREAPNGEAVLRAIEKQTGIRLQILDGPEEARLTFLASRRWFGWSAGTLLMLDIGGGSLEIAAGADEIPDLAVSLPLGAGRTTIGYFHEDPPRAVDVAALRKHADAVIAKKASRFAAIAPDHVVGSSKTIRSLARLAGNVIGGPGEHFMLRRAGLDDWIPRIARMPAAARQELPGITADRSFQIVAGAVVLSSAMHVLGVDELEVSPWALREGILLQYLDEKYPGHEVSVLVS